ncbi:hypothetical protein [Avibacterium paragallinarum]|uniref:hypothetical protein n=1 Tax=Avibacterium paragallinarum TaxID=728 RepID=UPI0039790566
MQIKGFIRSPTLKNAFFVCGGNGRKKEISMVKTCQKTQLFFYNHLIFIVFLFIFGKFLEWQITPFIKKARLSLPCF